MAMRVLLSLGPQQIVVGIISVYLESLDWSLQRELLEILGTPPRLSAQSMCSAADFKAYVPLVSSSFSEWSYFASLLSLDRLILRTLASSC